MEFCPGFLQSAMFKKSGKKLHYKFINDTRLSVYKGKNLEYSRKMKKINQESDLVENFIIYSWK